MFTWKLKKLKQQFFAAPGTMFMFIFYCEDKKDQSVNYTEKIYLFCFGLSYGAIHFYNKKHYVLCVEAWSFLLLIRTIKGQSLGAVLLQNMKAISCNRASKLEHLALKMCFVQHCKKRRKKTCEITKVFLQQ
jgi:hypothetical protein